MDSTSLSSFLRRNSLATVTANIIMQWRQLPLESIGMGLITGLSSSFEFLPIEQQPWGEHPRKQRIHKTILFFSMWITSATGTSYGGPENACTQRSHKPQALKHNTQKRYFSLNLLQYFLLTINTVFLSQFWFHLTIRVWQQMTPDC